MKKLSINVRIAIFIGLFISFVSSLLFGFKSVSYTHLTLPTTPYV